MNSVINVNESGVGWKDRIAYLLIFLFPIAGMSVRHWISAIFTFLVFLSFSFLFKKKTDYPLARDERVLLWIFFSFFIIFLVTAVINGWTERQTKYLGVEVRYLLAIPLYIMIRQLPDATIWLLKGCIIGGLVLGLQAFYDIEVLGQVRATGIYSPNLLGPVAVLMIFLSVIAFNTMEKTSIFRYLVPVAIIVSLYALGLSGSRGAYVAYLVIFIAWGFLSKNRRQSLVLMSVSLLLTAYVFIMVPGISDRLSDQYPGQDETQLSSTGARVEMWKASWLIFRENPILGIGRGNYEVIMPEYIENGYAPKALVAHGLGHPHNAYIEMLVSKGLIGFVVFMGMICFPLFVFIRKKSGSMPASMAGIVHLTGFSIFAIVDASTFIKGNYTSIFLINLVIFFSWHIRNVNGVVR